MSTMLAIGGLTVDWLQTPAGRFGPALGGNAAYAAVGAWLTRADPEVVAVVGDDYPPELLTQLATAGIGTSGVRVSPGPSFRVLLDESGSQRSISYLPGSGHNDRLDPLPSQLPTLDPKTSAHVCAIPTESQQLLVDALGGRLAALTLDTIVIPGEIEPARESLLSLARRVSVFMPSREEVAHHWPGTIDRALDELSEEGIERVIIKMGPDGSVGRDRSGTYRVPAASAVVVDPTGAGDAYCGAVCARFAQDGELRAAMAWGAAAASVVIEGHGVVHALSGVARELTSARQAELHQRLKSETLA